MNTVLQAIKSLFRGLENRISAKIAALTPRVTRVENNLRTVSSIANTAKKTADAAKKTADAVKKTADAAKKTADAVKKTADAVKETADAVKETADAAMVKASDAKRELSNLVRKKTLECPLELDGLRGVQIGEAYKVTTDGQMFTFLFPENAMLRVRFMVRDDNSIGFIYAILTTPDSYEATGFFNWQPENENNRVFVVRMTNYTSTSYVEMLRLA